jgi:holo-[acyl-carrier protein] synthase
MPDDRRRPEAPDDRRRPEAPAFPIGGAILSVGIDVAEVPRFRTVLARRPRLAERVFTEAERAYALRKRDPAERFAARFAAKEAVMKALGVGIGRFPFRDVEVTRQRSGAPGLALSSRAAPLSRQRGVVDWRISITHSELIAAVIVVALGPGPE